MIMRYASDEKLGDGLGTRLIYIHLLQQYPLSSVCGSYNLLWYGSAQAYVL